MAFIALDNKISSSSSSFLLASLLSSLPSLSSDFFFPVIHNRDQEEPLRVKGLSKAIVLNPMNLENSLLVMFLTVLVEKWEWIGGCLKMMVIVLGLCTEIDCELLRCCDGFLI
jgi:hypothetical protein